MSKINRFIQRLQYFTANVTSIGNEGFVLSSRRDLHMEVLESRVMLAGDISAAVIGDSLFIDGDNLNNSAELRIEGDDIVLRGVDDTTINGSSDDFVLFANNNAIDGLVVARFLGGDNSFLIDEGMVFASDVHIIMGSGDDAFGINASTLRDNLFISTSLGDDRVAFLNTTVFDSVFIDTSLGEDTVSVNTAQIGDHFVAHTGMDRDDIVFDFTTIEDHTILVTGHGQDNVAIRNSNLGGDLVALTGSDDDFLCIDPTFVDGISVVDMGSGNDDMIFVGANEFRSGLIVVGGAGSDNGQLEEANIVTGLDVNVLFESDVVQQSVIDERLNSPTTGALARGDAAQAIFGSSSIPGDGDLTLTLDTSNSPDTVQANGTLVSTEQNFSFAGSTKPNATIQIDSDGDGNFNDAITTADSQGNFSSTVDLTRGPLSDGQNQIRVRALDADDSDIVEQALDVHFAIGNVVQFNTSLGSFEVELIPDIPGEGTVENFLNYQGRGDFDDSIIHRSPENFVIQGGGFALNTGGDVVPIPTDPPITGEFDSANSNLRGTLSMALSGNPNTGTSGWFINVADNTSLDLAGHTVFGRVIGDGMLVVDAINRLATHNISVLTGNNTSLLTDTPLQNYIGFSVELSGTVSTQANQFAVTGTGTQFLSELQVGQAIEISGTEFVVTQINSDTEMTVTGAPFNFTSQTPVPFTTTTSVGEYLTNETPSSANFITISTVEVVLPQP